MSLRHEYGVMVNGMAGHRVRQALQAREAAGAYTGQRVVHGLRVIRPAKTSVRAAFVQPAVRPRRVRREGSGGSGECRLREMFAERSAYMLHGTTACHDRDGYTCHRYYERQAYARGATVTKVRQRESVVTPKRTASRIAARASASVQTAAQENARQYRVVIRQKKR